jgi:hypothetical protein
LDIQREVYCFRCNRTEVSFGIGAGILEGGPSGEFYVLTGPDPDDVGQEFFAPEGPALDGLKDALTWPNHGGLLGLTGPSAGGWYSTVSFNSNDVTYGSSVTPDEVFNRHAPELGPNLAGYAITALSLSVDQFEYTPIGSDWRGLGRFTIRVYGQPVPEPATWIVAGITIATFAFRRNR